MYIGWGLCSGKLGAGHHLSPSSFLCETCILSLPPCRPMERLGISSGMLSLPSLKRSFQSGSESSWQFPGPLSVLRGGSTHCPLCSWQWCSGVCRPGSSRPSLTTKKKPKKPPRCHCAQVQDFPSGPRKPKPPNAFKNNFTDEMRITSSNFYNRDFNHRQQNNSAASTILFKELRNLLSRILSILRVKCEQPSLPILAGLEVSPGSRILHSRRQMP